jgi:hypothetical protein
MPLPLGDAWRGLCRVPGQAPFEPEPATLVPFCHLGYARGRCAHFPTTDAGADAVRFVVCREGDAAIDVQFVCERAHHPFAHGSLRYSLALRGFVDAAEENLLRQAEAYIESYLRRKEANYGEKKRSLPDEHPSKQP